MNHASTFLIVATTATLLGCGKSEDPPAPATQPTAMEAPQAEPAMEPVTPVVETPQPEMATVTPPPEPPTAASPPAAAKPTPTRPVDAAPAAKTVGTSVPDLAHGQTIYRQACAFCHDKGVAGAPKPGDKDAWTPRLAQGMDALYAAALRGKGAMPAKGGNPALTENDVHAAVDYLVAQSR
ncbi:MAG: c-type cytochrome [Thiobacillus sp.]